MYIFTASRSEVILIFFFVRSVFLKKVLGIYARHVRILVLFISVHAKRVKKKKNVKVYLLLLVDWRIIYSLKVFKKILKARSSNNETFHFALFLSPCPHRFPVSFLFFCFFVELKLCNSSSMASFLFYVSYSMLVATTTICLIPY